MMRIGIDATCWWNRRGFGRFTRELLKAMLAQPARAEFTLFVDRPPDEAMCADHARIISVGTARSVTEAAVADDNRPLSDLLAFRRAAAAADLDLMFYPAVYSWYPPPSGVRSVVTFHDAIAEHFPALVFPNLKHRFFWKLKTRLADLTARRIVTVSEAAKQEIVEHLGFRAERIDVICEGASAVFRPVADASLRLQARERAGLPDRGRLILTVGGFAPHKNLLRLLEGFRQVADQPGVEDLQLVFVGAPDGAGFHSNYTELRTEVEKACALGGRVHFPGFVDDADLAALYSDALVLAMPSLSEGFGLPALEAISCGAPVIAAEVGAVAEIVGDAGLFFDPMDVYQIGQSIATLATVDEVRERLRARTLTQAQHNTWPRAAALTLDILERCAGAD
ncbi:MAG: glycosyltransferase family 1 protein [Alphaproteobacteria bacterium]